MSSWVSVCVCLFAQVHTKVTGWPQLFLHWLDPLCFLFCFCFETESVNDLGLLVRLSQLSSNPQEATCLSLPRPGMTSACHCAQLVASVLQFNLGPHVCAPSTFLTELSFPPSSNFTLHGSLVSWWSRTGNSLPVQMVILKGRVPHPNPYEPREAIHIVSHLYSSIPVPPQNPASGQGTLLGEQGVC